MDNKFKILIIVLSIAIISLIGGLIATQYIEMTNAVKLEDGLYLSGVVYDTNKSVKDYNLTQNISNVKYTNRNDKNLSTRQITYHLSHSTKFNNTNFDFAVSVTDVDEKDYLYDEYKIQAARKKLHDLDYNSDGSIFSSLTSIYLSMNQLSYPEITITKTTLIDNRTNCTEISEGFFGGSYYVLPLPKNENKTLTVSTQYVDIHQNIFIGTVITGVEYQ
jgi:hypothetical protein